LDEEKLRRLVSLLGPEARRGLLKFFVNRGVKLAMIAKLSNVSDSTLRNFIYGRRHSIRDDIFLSILTKIIELFPHETKNFLEKISSEIRELAEEI